MIQNKVLTVNEILEKGIEFSGDVCFSGEYGQQIFDAPLEAGGKPINGIIYETYKNGNIKYYQYYKNGFADGDYVLFYESGEIKELCVMKNGSKWGGDESYFENGNKKRVEQCKFGIILSFKEFDVDGNLIGIKEEPNSIEKKILTKFQKIFEKENQSG